MHIHIDGCFSPGFSDFVLLAKFEEIDTEGGESKIVHVQNITDLASVLDHPLAWQEYLFKGRSAHNTTQGFYRPLFWKERDTVRINFNIATVVPRNDDEARFLEDLHERMCASALLMTLLPGQCLILNNTFWLHGRSKFLKISEASRRGMLRMRGPFQSREYEARSEIFAQSSG